MEVSAREQDFVDSVRRLPGARQPATIGEIWDAEWTRSGLDTIGGVGQPFTQAYDELHAALESKGGAPVDELARRAGVNMGAAVTRDQRIAALNAIADTLPENERKAIEPLRDVRRRASDKAQTIEREAGDIAASTYGISGHATAFLAGVARQTVDPVNIAANIVTAPLGGPLSGPVLRVVARQAAAGAAAQAFVEPYVESTRGELGLESGFAHGAMNVAQSAIGAGGLSALFRASAAAVRYVRTPRQVHPPLGDGATAFEPTFLGYMDHEDAAAFNRGERLDRPHSLADVPEVPGFGGSFDISEGAAARPTRERGPEVPQTRSDYAPGVISPEDVAAFDRGHAVERVAALGDGAPDAPGTFNIDAGAAARPDRGRLPERPLTRSDYAPSVLSPEDVAAFDRGIPVETPHNLGGSDDLPWRGFDALAPADLEAAARFAEREQLVDAAAPAHWDRAVHQAMVDEARAALEAGRPIDRAKAAAAIAEATGRHTDVVAIASNAIADAVIEVKPAKRFGVHNMAPENTSLFQFLASIGGLHPQDMRARDAAGALFGEAQAGGGLTGELAHILDGNPFVPGFGKLLRKTGLTLDRARMNAAEAGYLPRGSTINDFLTLVREEAGGNRQYPEGHVAEPRRADPAHEKELRAESAAARAADFDARMTQELITKVTKTDRKRALQIMEKEGQPDALLAYEQALVEKQAAKEKLRARRTQEPDLTIPFFDVADDAGPASQVGRDPAGGAGAGSGQPGDGGAARGAGDRAGTPAGEAELGDPALTADFDRAVAVAGDNFQVTVTGEDGAARKAPPAALIAEAKEQSRAAGELFECLGVATRTPEINPIPGQRLKPFGGGGA